MAYYLGIDTSNYTTSVALYDSVKKIMLQSKKLLPVKDGTLGLRQSDAVFHHTAQLHLMIQNVFYGKKIKLDAIGVSSKPRPVENSYMPCFSVGCNSAKILSNVLNIPLYEFSHQEGHISAALYSSERFDLFKKQFIAFHVSGGTTESLMVKPKECSFDITLVAKTLDLNAGQAIDRVGLMLGLSFPCGAQLEKLALECNDSICVKPTLKGFDCCLSGIENKCKKLIDNNKSREYVAKYCIEYIKATLFSMSVKLESAYGNVPFVFAGGVMSNSLIRESFQQKLNASFAKPEFSTDNAAGIAYLAYRKDKNVKS